MLRARSVRLLVVAITLCMATATAGCGRDAPAASQVGTTVIAQGDRQPLPPVAGTTLDGSALDLTGLRGKVVVLNSWASWCEPCKEEIPTFVTLDKAVDPADVEIVGLDVSDDPAAAKAFTADYGMAYPSIVDESGEVLASLPDVPPKAIPSTLVVDRSGNVAARIIGSASPDELSRIVAQLSAEKPSS